MGHTSSTLARAASKKQPFPLLWGSLDRDCKLTELMPILDTEVRLFNASDSGCLPRIA